MEMGKGKEWVVNLWICHAKFSLKNSAILHKMNLVTTLPSHTSPNCPLPSFLSSLIDLLGISQTSLLISNMAGFCLGHGFINLHTRPSACALWKIIKKKQKIYIYEALLKKNGWLFPFEVGLHYFHSILIRRCHDTQQLVIRFCFCFVLFCFVLFRVLFCFVLFCFVLFCFVLFCFCFVFQRRNIFWFIILCNCLNSSCISLENKKWDRPSRFRPNIYKVA